MDLVIYKYKLEVTNRQVIKVYEGARLLSIQKQGDDIVAWFLLNPTEQDYYLPIWCFGTGHTVPKHVLLSHLATIQCESLVWHFFCENDEDGTVAGYQAADEKYRGLVEAAKSAINPENMYAGPEEAWRIVRALAQLEGETK